MKQKQHAKAEGRGSRTARGKCYEPVISKAEGRRLNAEVGLFEEKTSFCPLHLAWRIVDEACDYFRTDIPDAVPVKLARRAEAVFAHQPFWRRKYQSVRGREYVLMTMRHWLAGALARENPVLFRQLPETFKIGRPLPEVGSPRRVGRPAPQQSRSRLQR